MSLGAEIFVGGTITIIILALFWSNVIRTSLKDQFTSFGNLEIEDRNIPIGALSGIAIDMHRRMILYSRGFRLHVLIVSDVFRSDADWAHFLDKSKKHSKILCGIRLQTNSATCSEIEVTYWRKSQLDRCIGSFKELKHASDLVCKSTQGQKPKRLALEEQLTAAEKLTSFAQNNGFPSAASKEEVNKTRAGEAVVLMVQNYKTVTGHELPKRTPVKVISMALDPIFGINEQRPFGFEPSYLRELATKNSPMRKG